MVKIPKFVDAAQKIFTHKRFENWIQIIMKKPTEDSDESKLDSGLESNMSNDNSEGKDESNDNESKEDQVGVLAAWLQRMEKKIKHIQIQEPMRSPEPEKCLSGDLPIDEIVRKMKGLSLKDEEYKKLSNKAM